MFSKFYGNKYLGNIASFDLDHTLIMPASGKKFPKSKDDIKWWNDKIPLLLKKLEESFYDIVIFTNQGGIKSGKHTIEDIQWRINWVIENAKLNGLSYYIAYESDKYRKPLPGMWDTFVSEYGKPINFKKSFYCGDAAGRKSDFSQSDLFFAQNCGLIFKTPEEFIGVKSIEPICDKFIDWKIYDEYSYTFDIKNMIKKISKFEGSQLILMVGPPGSGKSTFCKTFMGINPLYILLSLDETKTKTSFNTIFNRTIKLGHSIILDNTHCKRVNRMEFINPAKKNNYSIIVVNFKTPLNVSMHMNIIRKYNGKKEIIPFVVYASWRKYYEQIDILEEGIDLYFDYCPILDDDCLIKKYKTNGFYSKKIKNTNE